MEAVGLALLQLGLALFALSIVLGWKPSTKTRVGELIAGGLKILVVLLEWLLTGLLYLVKWIRATSKP